jgi:hypothetical protein
MRYCLALPGCQAVFLWTSCHYIKQPEGNWASYTTSHTAEQPTRLQVLFTVSHSRQIKQGHGIKISGPPADWPRGPLGPADRQQASPGYTTGFNWLILAVEYNDHMLSQHVPAQCSVSVNGCYIDIARLGSQQKAQWASFHEAVKSKKKPVNASHLTQSRVSVWTQQQHKATAGLPRHTALTGAGL